jgi:hypothetical protein
MDGMQEKVVLCVWLRSRAKGSDGEGMVSQHRSNKPDHRKRRGDDVSNLPCIKTKGHQPRTGATLPNIEFSLIIEHSSWHGSWM